MVFADRYEEQAHDVICMIRYGGIGGSVPTKLVKQVGDYLRGGPHHTTVKPKLPPLPKMGALPPLPAVGLPPLPSLPLPPLPKLPR